MYDEIKSVCHPLLSGERDDDFSNASFSLSEMETLSCMCEVILPPLPLNSLDSNDHDKEMQESIDSFLVDSGSRYPIPNKVKNIYYNV